MPGSLPHFMNNPGLTIHFSENKLLSDCSQLSLALRVLNATNVSSTFIPASFVKFLVSEMVAAERDPSLIVAGEPVSFEELVQATEVDAALFGRMCQRAMQELDDEALGLVSGGPVVTGTFRMMCLCVIHCSNLCTVVRRAGEFLDVSQLKGVRPEPVSVDDLSCIGFATVVRDPRSINDIMVKQHPVAVRSSLYLWHSLLSWFAGRELPLVKVVFGFQEPDRAESWKRLFKAPIEFNGSQSMLCFDPDILKLPNIRSEQNLSAFLKSAPFRLIVPSYYQQPLHERVIALFGDDFTQPLPGADEVSRQLGMSVSSLRRVLSEEGWSYQKLKDKTRLDAARQYLAAGELTLTQVSQLLGFDETSAFFRAFKRWTGQTPSQYRECLIK